MTITGVGVHAPDIVDKRANAVQLQKIPAFSILVVYKPHTQPLPKEGLLRESFRVLKSTSIVDLRVALRYYFLNG